MSILETCIFNLNQYSAITNYLIKCGQKNTICVSCTFYISKVTSKYKWELSITPQASSWVCSSSSAKSVSRSQRTPGRWGLPGETLRMLSTRPPGPCWSTCSSPVGLQTLLQALPSTSPEIASWNEGYECGYILAFSCIIVHMTVPDISCRDSYSSC